MTLSLLFILDFWISFISAGAGSVSGLMIPLVSGTPFILYIGFEVFRSLSLSENK